MKDLKFDDSNRKEVIDGVTVVHTGMIQYTNGINNEELRHEVLEMYDANGNSFYSNFKSVEEASKAVVELAEKGITAVIGPKAPWIDPETGEPIHNGFKNDVGVYIVSVPEKSDDFSHKTR